MKPRERISPVEQQRISRAEQIRRIIEKLEYDDDPKRKYEFIRDCLRWLSEAEKADYADMHRITREIERQLEGKSYVRLPSWNGSQWTKAADIRTIVESEIKDRGLGELFDAAALLVKPGKEKVQ